ncbi:MAG TPA: class I SAM-dependent methyltransferase [Rhizomicrobium sp.]
MANVAAMPNRNISQAMRPHGRVGRIFGWLMGRLNKPAYRWTLAQIGKPRSVLEIGFGTGHLLKMIARQRKPARIVGVDPSELMVETAAKRLKPFRKKIEIDLKRGDDTALPAQGPFDAIAALHSFQFWEHPGTTLAHIHALLAPEGRFVMVLRVHPRGRKDIPNPLSRTGNEVGQAIAAAQQAGFTLHSMEGLSKTSQGLVFGRG